MLENQNLNEFSGIGNKSESIINNLLNRIIRENRVNLPCLCNAIYSKESGTKEYMRLYRLLDSLASEGALNYEKIDGLKWYSATPKTINLLLDHRKRLNQDLITFSSEGNRGGSPEVDLTKGESKTIQSVKPHVKTENQEAIERRALNLKFIRRSQYWKDSQFLMQYRELTPFGWKKLNDAFENYKESVEDKILLFKKKGEDRYCALPYTHRFQSKKVMERITEYNQIWDNANKYQRAVHLTLTFPPDLTLQEISKTICEKFNKLTLWIKRITKHKDLQFLRVLEFTDRGVFHIHLIVFGVGRICDKKTILTPKLISLGFGKINYIYSMENRNGKWIWKKTKPEDAKENNPRSHFKKYLEKALQEDHEKISAYWLTGKRFYSCSYGLLDSCSREFIERSAEWEYIGIFTINELPDFVYSQLDFSKGEIT